MYKMDSYVLTPEILHAIRKHNFPDHIIVLTGYDNEGVIIDQHGTPYSNRGVIKFRNSLGENKGDHGDFYMDYNYLKILGVAAVEVWAD